MKANPGQISKYVIFSGDPWRVNVFQNILNNVEKVAFAREFNTLTGTYQGVQVTVTSTGIGAPSAVISMEEMYECGMEVAIRMGTVMSLDDGMVGDFLIPFGSMRKEATSDCYVEKSYPAIANFELIQALNQAVLMNGSKYHNGIHCTLDGYYTDMKTSRFAKERDINPEKTMRELAELKVLGVDMESSAMLVVGRLMGVKTGVITLATVSQNLNRKLEDEERNRLEALLCKVTLDAIVTIDKLAV
jgi:uridine phosphorylase